MSFDHVLLQVHVAAIFSLQHCTPDTHLTIDCSWSKYQFYVSIFMPKHVPSKIVTAFYYTVLRLRGRTPDAGSDPPFAPQCKRKSPAPIAGSDPPFMLLQICRVRPRMRGLTLHFCVCKQKAGVCPRNVWNFSKCGKQNFLLELVRSAPLVGSAP